MKIPAIILSFVTLLCVNTSFAQTGWNTTGATTDDMYREGRTGVGVIPNVDDPLNNGRFIVGGRVDPTHQIFGTRLGHLERGPFGAIISGSKWISIGRSPLANDAMYGLWNGYGENFAALGLDTPNMGPATPTLSWGFDQSSKFKFLFRGDPQNANNAVKDVMTMTAEGRVGIGIDEPTTPLHVMNGAIQVMDDQVTDPNFNISAGIMAIARKPFDFSNISTPGDFTVRGITWYTDLILGAPVHGSIRFEVAGPNSPHEKMTLNNDGNLGIGVTTPAQRLDVDGTARLRGLSNDNGLSRIIAADNDGVLHWRDANDLSPWTFGTGGHTGNINFGVGGGNVGIGTNQPEAPLHLTSGNAVIGDAGTIQPTGFRLFVQEGIHTNDLTCTGDIGIGTTTPEARLHLPTGKMLIGTAGTRQEAGFRLYVEEGILTEKVVVALRNSNDWMDKVFDDDYDLKSVEEVEQFVKTNHHLPGIPSAEEVVEQGIDVAKMDAALLQQIEELWLHMIEIKKENELLRERTAQLEAQLKSK